VEWGALKGLTSRRMPQVASTGIQLSIEEKNGSHTREKIGIFGQRPSRKACKGC